MGSQMSTAMWEGFCAGNMHWPVRGVVVCYAPTLEVLRRAAAEGKTLIVTREHPFYMRRGHTPWVCGSRRLLGPPAKKCQVCALMKTK